MIFHSLYLNKAGIITAEAEGHATEVVEAFRNVAGLLLSGAGRWRITEVTGLLHDSTKLDSEMKWELKAEIKD